MELRAISLHKRIEFQAHERIDGVEPFGPIQGDDADARLAGIIRVVVHRPFECFVIHSKAPADIPLQCSEVLRCRNSRMHQQGIQTIIMSQSSACSE